MRSNLMGLRSLAAFSLVVFAPHLAAQTRNPESFFVRHQQLDIAIDYAAGRLSGTETVQIENWTKRPSSSVSFLLNRLMEASQIRDASGERLFYTQDVVRFEDNPKRQVTQVIVRFPQPVPPGARTTVSIQYAGYITPSTDFGWNYVKDRIDTTFTLVRWESLAFPVIHTLNEAANKGRFEPDFTYDVSVRVPAKYQVALGGALERTPHADGTITWRYQSGAPASSLNIGIAPFDTLRAPGVRLFALREDSVGARRVLSAAHSALTTLERWYGPLRSSPTITITEIPDGWGSQADLVSGTILAAAAFRDAGRVHELYHELTHLWNVNDLETPSPRWNEGLATFLEDLLRERLDGWTKRAAADSGVISWLRGQLARDSLLRSVPAIDYGKRNITDYSYWVGGIMFSSLYEFVGEETFERIIGGYYREFPGGGTTRDFVAFAKRTAPVNLTSFFDDWVYTTGWAAVVSQAATTREIVEHYRADKAAQR
jgi:hypothetical protein